jgi:hypothetical protein
VAFVSVSERGAPAVSARFLPDGRPAVAVAGLEVKAHAHMLLRHACGDKLANDGHETPAIQATTRYNPRDAGADTLIYLVAKLIICSFRYGIELK